MSVHGHFSDQRDTGPVAKTPVAVPLLCIGQSTGSRASAILGGFQYIRYFAAPASFQAPTSPGLGFIPRLIGLLGAPMGLPNGQHGKNLDGRKD